MRRGNCAAALADDAPASGDDTPAFAADTSMSAADTLALANDVLAPAADASSLADDAAPAYVYMVECADGTLYTGWTTEVDRRVAAHNAGQGAKYTRSRRPVRLCYSEQCTDKSAALRREHAIKRLTRAQKEQLAKKAQ